MQNFYLKLYVNLNYILLELYPNNYSLKLFNCCFISSYGSEQEILFFCHKKPIEIHSIINLNDNENYRLFIKAITLFNQFVNGKILNKRFNVTNMDYFIINSLSQTNNIFPKYINNLFESFCLNKININLNIGNIQSFYPGFAVGFISSKCDNLVKFDSIVKIFKNCDNINVEISQNDEQKMSYFDEYLQNRYKDVELENNPGNNNKDRSFEDESVSIGIITTYIGYLVVNVVLFIIMDYHQQAPITRGRICNNCGILGGRLI